MGMQNAEIERDMGFVGDWIWELTGDTKLLLTLSTSVSGAAPLAGAAAAGGVGGRGGGVHLLST